MSTTLLPTTHTVHTLRWLSVGTMIIVMGQIQPWASLVLLNLINFMVTLPTKGPATWIETTTTSIYSISCTIIGLLMLTFTFIEISSVLNHTTHLQLLFLTHQILP